ncbi:zinc ribbon domain-containing protein [Candidatus Peregrinibacteria bacterium]|nr:zinc ribbon domain-containing protein [Candidatus Peregrinibacteria bacterium]
MPSFDFQCRACQHVFEFARPFGSSAQPACPSCSSKRVEKLIAPPAVHFKGSGWYKTDSRPVIKPEKKKEEKKTEAPASEPKIEKKDISAQTKHTHKPDDTAHH